MARLKTLLTFALLPVLLGCTTPGVFLPKYDAADAGFLVSSLGAKAGTFYTDYSLSFRKRNELSKEGFHGRLYWGQGNIFEGRQPDFDDGTRKGIVEVSRLPPGDYELYNFEVSDTLSKKRFRAKQDFSYPFTIRSGAGTYIGEFLAVGITKGPDGPSAGAFFVVSNMADRDIAVAKRKEPGLPAVTPAVADVRSLGTPLLQAGTR